MARWVQPAPVKSIIDDLVGQEGVYTATGTVLDGVVDVLQAAETVLEVAEAIASPDPLSAIAGAAIQEFQSFILNLLGADIYALPIMPHAWRDLLRPYSIDMALNDFAASTSDMLDGSRPILDSRAAYASITVMVGANNWLDFTKLIRLLGELFDGTEGNKWSRLADLRLNFDSHIPLPRRERNSQGTPWDWSRTNWLEQIPPINDFVEWLFGLADSLVGGARGLTGALAQLIENLIERIEYIREVTEEIRKIADLIRRWRELFPRLHVLVASNSEGGTQGYVDTVTNAVNRPEFKLCAGITFVAFGPNAVANIEAVGRLIGLKTDEFNAAVDNAEAAV